MKTELKRITLDQLREVIADSKPTRYVYGLRGIQELFNVSHKTAQLYKNGILRDACYQYGRKIIVDADKAISLFKQANQ